MIDPIGFGFENYDGIGRWRDIEGEHEIDASGEILQSMSSDGSFIGVPGLSVLLASQKRFHLAMFSNGLSMEQDWENSKIQKYPVHCR